MNVTKEEIKVTTGKTTSVILHGTREYLLGYKFSKYLTVAVGPDFLVRYF